MVGSKLVVDRLVETSASVVESRERMLSSVVLKGDSPVVINIRSEVVDVGTFISVVVERKASVVVVGEVLVRS